MSTSTQTNDIGQVDGKISKGNGLGSGETPPVRASKATSCNECRRLKLRCSKVWPCDMCVKRRLAHLCPDGVQKPDRPKMNGPRNSIGSNGATDVSHMATSTLDGDKSRSIWTRLSSVEQKLDILLADRGLQADDSRRSGSGLHDLANVASDYIRFDKDSNSPGQKQGLLAMHADGRESYVGPHAHSLYLARGDVQSSSFANEKTQNFPASRPGSPTPVDFEVVTSQSRNNEDGISPFDTTTPSNSDAHASLVSWATPGFRSPHSSADIWTHLSPMLPSSEVARRLVDVYYASVSFMHELIPRSVFETEIYSIFYGDALRSNQPPANFHAHKMAVLFAVLSLGILLDVRRPQRDPVGRAFYSCAWNALVSANFTESTSLDAILALAHVSIYLTWRRAGRYAESAWPLFGILTSMMTRSGLHRDPANFDLSEEDREKRRQVFWDLQSIETLRALGFCRPPGILDRHVDTRLPNSWKLNVEAGKLNSFEHRMSAFHAAKIMQAQLINRILDDCLCATSTYPTVLRYDEKIRALFDALPEWMTPSIRQLSRRSNTGNEDMEKTYTDESARKEMLHTMRSHLTHLNLHQIRLLLHRGWFSEALRDLSEYGNAKEEISNSSSSRRLQASVDVVNESASNMIELVISAWSHYPSLVLRWMFFWNGLFSAAVCRALYAIRRRRGAEAHSAWRDLRSTIALLRLAVDDWKPLESPLGILLRLDKRAEMALGSAAGKKAETHHGDDQQLDDPVHHDHAQVAAEAADAARAANLRGEDLSLIGDSQKTRNLSTNTPSSKHTLSSMTEKGDDQKGHKRQTKRVRIQDDTETGSSEAVIQSMQDIKSTPTNMLPSAFQFGATPSSGEIQSVSSTGFEPSLFSPDGLIMPASLPAFMVSGSAGNIHDDVLTISSAMTNRTTGDEETQVGGITPSNSLSNPVSNAFASVSNASQLLQMLSAGWDDVSSWDDAIFDI